MTEELAGATSGPSADLPPPPPPSPGRPSPPFRTDGSFDLGGLLSFAFKDPNALSKFLIGSLMVLLIPILLGLIALLGYSFRTTQRTLAGEEHPLAEWSDFGGILLDGIRVLALMVVYGAGALLAGLVLVLFNGLAAALGGTAGSALLVVISTIGAVISVCFAIIGAFVAAMLLPTAILRMAATNQFADGFLIRENLDLAWKNVGTYLFLLVSLLLIAILADLTILLCLIGAIPGAFWGYAVCGAAIGHGGVVMKIETS